MSVVITAVMPQPRVDLRSHDGETGRPVRVTTYRGVAVLEFQWTQGTTVTRVPETNPISFFLPDSLPYPAGQDGVASATVSMALQPISGGSTTADGPYGVHGAAARLVDDPGGSGVRWVQLEFVNTYATRHTEVAYEVTVVVALAE